MARKSGGKPVTIERVERALDVLARVMSKATHDEALLMAPIWIRLERELAEMKDAENAVVAAKERFARIEQNRRRGDG